MKVSDQFTITFPRNDHGELTKEEVAQFYETALKVAREIPVQLVEAPSESPQLEENLPIISAEVCLNLDKRFVFVKYHAVSGPSGEGIRRVWFDSNDFAKDVVISSQSSRTQISFDPATDVGIGRIMICF